MSIPNLNGMNQSVIGFNNVPASEVPDKPVSDVKKQSGVAKPVIQGSGFNSSAVNTSMDLQAEKTLKITQNETGAALPKLGEFSSQPQGRIIGSTNVAGGIVSGLESIEKDGSAKINNPSVDLAKIVANINSGRLNEYFKEISLDDLFKAGPENGPSIMKQIVDILNSGDSKQILTDVMFGTDDIGQRTTLYMMLNDPNFESLADENLSSEDLAKINEFKADFNSRSLLNEVSMLKGKVIERGTVDKLFVAEHHSIVAVFCRAVANFFRSIFGGEGKTLDNDDLIGKASKFAQDHGYVLHMMMGKGGMDVDKLRDLLFEGLQGNINGSDETLRGYADDMAKTMKKELPKWEEGNRVNIIDNIDSRSFVPSLLADDYAVANKQEKAHEFFHLICAAGMNLDNLYMDEMISLCSYYKNSSAEIYKSLSTVFDKLPDLQKSKVKSLWKDGVRDEITNKFMDINGNIDPSFELTRKYIDEAINRI